MNRGRVLVDMARSITSSHHDKENHELIRNSSPSLLSPVCTQREDSHDPIKQSTPTIPSSSTIHIIY